MLKLQPLSLKDPWQSKTKIMNLLQSSHFSLHSLMKSFSFSVCPSLHVWTLLWTFLTASPLYSFCSHLLLLVYTWLPWWASPKQTDRQTDWEADWEAAVGVRGAEASRPESHVATIFALVNKPFFFFFLMLISTSDDVNVICVALLNIRATRLDLTGV